MATHDPHENTVPQLDTLIPQLPTSAALTAIAHAISTAAPDDSSSTHDLLIDLRYLQGKVVEGVAEVNASRNHDPAHLGTADLEPRWPQEHPAGALAGNPQLARAVAADMADRLLGSHSEGEGLIAGIRRALQGAEDAPAQAAVSAFHHVGLAATGVRTQLGKTSAPAPARTGAPRVATGSRFATALGPTTGASHTSGTPQSGTFRIKPRS